MPDSVVDVIEGVRKAFHGVKLGNGVGLRQGRGLDDYAATDELARLRANDEKDDWSAIPVEDLNCYSSSLSFFDAEGMRFHLPAFLIADLKGELSQDVLFHLTYLTPELISYFDLLSPPQREAIVAYLRLPRSEPHEGFVRPRIERALANYWSVERS